MIRFECDYAEGSHPLILKKLEATNFEQTLGYGEDLHCENARKLICQWCDDETLDVHFMVGGTQTNTTVIASILRPHQGAISAHTAHVNVHETGAIESTGHKVITMLSNDGKVSAEQVEEIYQSHWNDINHEHIVQPGMVYISNPTEVGTLYTKSELEDLSRICHHYHLPLYMDGARLGYGLASPYNDLTIKDITRCCDVFYIGGTKVGALFGEAVVIKHSALKKDFRYLMKQRGGMLAKGRLLGIQFEVLFSQNLYLEISKHAVDMALRIRKAFNDKGIKFLYNSYTNQQFPILPNSMIQNLSKKYAFGYWEKVSPQETAMRFCTSWATREEDISLLESDIKLFTE